MMKKNTVFLICLSLSISFAHPHSNSPININNNRGFCVLNRTASTATATLCTSSTLLGRRSNDFPQTMSHYWVSRVLFLWGTLVLFMSLEEMEGEKKAQRQKRNKKQEGWIFHRFYYFSGKAPRKSDKHRPQLENRKAVWQADKAWGSDMPHPMYKTTQQTHYHLYENNRLSGECRSSLTMYSHKKKVVVDVCLLLPMKNFI